jgi:hypothetical protein
METPLPSPTATNVVQVLRRRSQVATCVELQDGRELVVWNIAWGQDYEDPEFHVTTNISPSVEGGSIDLFRTDEVRRIVDPVTGAILLVV